MNERCSTLLGSHNPESGTWRVGLQRGTVGEPTRVEADWAWTLAREEAHLDVVGFYHTHPSGAGTRPSPRDVRTMQAWCSALGKPLLCLIAEEGQPGEAQGFVFENDEHPGSRVGTFTFGEEGEAGELTIE
jgi:hypothetical protein